MNETLKAEADNPSFAFGAEQGVFVYKAAASMTGSTERSVAERAEDAARTAIRVFGRDDIDADAAAAGLMDAIKQGLDIS